MAARQSQGATQSQTHRILRHVQCDWNTAAVLCLTCAVGATSVMRAKSTPRRWEAVSSSQQQPAHTCSHRHTHGTTAQIDPPHPHPCRCQADAMEGLVAMIIAEMAAPGRNRQISGRSAGGTTVSRLPRRPREPGTLASGCMPEGCSHTRNARAGCPCVAAARPLAVPRSPGRAQLPRSHSHSQR